MKNALLFLSILFFSVVISFGSFCEEVAVREWFPYSGIEGLSSVDNVLTMRSVSPIPLLTTRDNIFINASRLKVLEIRLRSNKSYMTGRMFFRRIGDPGFNYNNSFDFQTGLSNIYHRYIIDLGRNPNWFGTVTQLMLSPINDKGSVEIASVSFMEPNIFIMTSVFWQEFLAFERPIPRTINVIFGPKINGVAINVYIYYSILFLSLLYLIFFSIKLKNIKAILNIIIPRIIVICFVFWILLDARILVDQIRFAILNYQIFGGNNFEEKQALSTFQYYRDFYYFLKICKQKLPERALYSLVVPDGYIYFDIKARYYLYPICEIRASDETPDYVIVYDPQKLLKGKDVVPKGYKIYTKCNEAGYIVKRSGSI